jgi:hypothetical protein
MDPIYRVRPGQTVETRYSRDAFAVSLPMELEPVGEHRSLCFCLTFSQGAVLAIARRPPSDIESPYPNGIRDCPYARCSFPNDSCGITL